MLQSMHSVTAPLVLGAGCSHLHTYHASGKLHTGQLWRTTIARWRLRCCGEKTVRCW